MEGDSINEGPANDNPRTGSFTKALQVAAFGMVIFGALLVAVDGVLSLSLDIDVISETDAGPLVGPLMALGALVIVFCCLVFAMKPLEGRSRIPIATSVVSAILIYLLCPFIGAVAYWLGKHEIAAGTIFYSKYLTSPFVIASALLALLVILVLPPLARARAATLGKKSI